MANMDMKHQADKLWKYFEENIFVNNGRFSYNTNLVFAFADYIDSLSDDRLSEFLENGNAEDVKAFRQMLGQGIDRWLEQFSKTMAIM